MAYQFYISDAYSPRPYGLTVNLFYQDAVCIILLHCNVFLTFVFFLSKEANTFYSNVFNETINIVELDEGLDGETFFLFVILGALGVLTIVGLYQLLQSFGVSLNCLNLFHVFNCILL